MGKPTEAQIVRTLHAALFKATEGVQGDAWISDDASTESLAEFFEFIEGHLAANREASKIIAAFLRKHKKLRSPASLQDRGAVE